jgi:molybdopterin-synthase adenylyltransferase
MNDEQLLRYSRHILLDDIGVEGQQRLLGRMRWSSAPAGWGRRPCCTWAPPASAASRWSTTTRWTPPTCSARSRTTWRASGSPRPSRRWPPCAAINPEVQLHALVQRADAALLEQLVPQADVVLDCSDNFATRHAINAACVRHRKPLVSGAAIGFDARLSRLRHAHRRRALLRLRVPADDALEDAACATMGVFAPLVGIVGSVQAAEALKLLAGIGEPLAGRLLMLDARSMQWTEIRVARQPHCPVCANSG